MREYYKANRDGWNKRTPEIRKKYNENRRDRYASDENYRIEICRSTSEYHRKNPEKRLAQRLKQYGITIDEYYGILEKQGGKCAICGSTDSGDKRTKRFHLDHCHETGKVRGLLCASCNMGIGKFKESPDILLRASKYLSSFVIRDMVPSE
ncbi:MAG: endonuclease VII domain-containing protein [Deltaproteobacteria bacterium]|nr:endonuclease VII domain-containing protein [Deltaproteobacteria bacterium]